MFSIQFDHTVDVDICMTDIIGNLNSFSRSNLMELKSEIEDEIGGVYVPTLNRNDNTIENEEKIKFLVDNIWNIDLKDLETIKK